MNTITNNTEELTETNSRKLFSIFRGEQTSYVHHIYLSSDLVEPSEYADLMFLITTASEIDTIVIHINAHGGNLDTGIQLINSIKASDAKIITSLEAVAYSMASMIFLAGDEFVVHNNALMMFHNFSGGVSGKGHEIFSTIDATRKWFQGIANDMYYPFLSKQEIKDMFEGKDFYFQSTEIIPRLRKLATARNKENSEIDAEKAITLID